MSVDLCKRNINAFAVIFNRSIIHFQSQIHINCNYVKVKGRVFLIRSRIKSKAIESLPPEIPTATLSPFCIML